MSAGRNINSLSQDWCTPPKYVEVVNEMFDNSIDLDPCSNEFSIVNATTKFELPNQDGLFEEWNYKTIYVNPPYGRDKNRKTTIKDWFKKCFKAYNEYNSEVLTLVPVATNTSHWKHYDFQAI